MEYRRTKILGGKYFFTVVTYARKNILTDPVNVALLRNAFHHVMDKYPFKIDAFVLLPDHLHLDIAGWRHGFFKTMAVDKKLFYAEMPS